jgi:hypothetical protein
MLLRLQYLLSQLRKGQQSGIHLWTVRLAQPWQKVRTDIIASVGAVLVAGVDAIGLLQFGQVGFDKISKATDQGAHQVKSGPQRMQQLRSADPGQTRAATKMMQHSLHAVSSGMGGQDMSSTNLGGYLGQELISQFSSTFLRLRRAGLIGRACLIASGFSWHAPAAWDSHPLGTAKN